MRVVRRSAVGGTPPFPATCFSFGPSAPGEVIGETEWDPQDGPLVIDGSTYVEVACSEPGLLGVAQGLRCSDSLAAEAAAAGCASEIGDGDDIGLRVNGEQWDRYFSQSIWGREPKCQGEVIAPSGMGISPEPRLASVSTLVDTDYEFEAYAVFRAEPGFFHVLGQVPETDLAVEEVWLDLRPTNEVVEEILTQSPANGLVGADSCPVRGPETGMGNMVYLAPAAGLNADQKRRVLRAHLHPCGQHDDQPVEVEAFGRTYRWSTEARSWVEAGPAEP